MKTLAIPSWFLSVGLLVGSIQFMGISSCSSGAVEECGDAYDNDEDGLIDCLDSDCAAAPECGYTSLSRVDGSLDLASFSTACGGIACALADLEVGLVGSDGGYVRSGPLDASGFFAFDVQPVAGVEVMLRITRISSGQTIGTFVYDSAAGGVDQNLGFPIATVSGGAVQIHLGLLTVPAPALARISSSASSPAATSGEVVLTNADSSDSPAAQTDSDWDGTSDLEDQDDDNDGTGDEGEEPPPFDADGDTQPNELDTDDDSDAIKDAEDTDDDGDGVDDLDEEDTDEDGVSDAEDVDNDNDGEDNDEDQDDDGDELPDSEEPDSDGDGEPDDKDKDDDNDGTSDKEDVDDDGDGVSDGDDLDHCSGQCDALSAGDISQVSEDCNCNLARTKIKGSVSAVDPDGRSFTVNSISVMTNSNTRYDGDVGDFAGIVVGLCVEVEAGALDAGGAVAYEVEQKDCGGEAPEFKAESDVASVDAGSGSFTLVDLTGALGPIPVFTDSSTRFESPLTGLADLAVGQRLEVEGAVLQSDGTYLARKVKLEDREEEEDEDEFEVNGVVESIGCPQLSLMDEDGALIEVTVSENTVYKGVSGCEAVLAGDEVEIEGSMLPDGTLAALKVKVEREDDEDEELEAEGILTAVACPGFTLSANGVEAEIQTDASTEFKEVEDCSGLAVGQAVEVKLVRQSDGSLLALSVKLEEDEEDKEDKGDDGED